MNANEYVANAAETMPLWLSYAPLALNLIVAVATVFALGKLYCLNSRANRRIRRETREMNNRFVRSRLEQEEGPGTHEQIGRPGA
jgi:hypothetical protein